KGVAARAKPGHDGATVGAYSRRRSPRNRRMQLDPKEVEEIAKTLYIRAVKLLPPDIKRGFERLMAKETDATGRAVLNTMVENIVVAEKRQNLLRQDT